MNVYRVYDPPLQVSYLIYPGTSGAGFLDYLISDRHVTPPETSHGGYSEKLIFLPHTYQVSSLFRRLCDPPHILS